MSDLRFTPGAVVDVRSAIRGGSWRVAEYRIRSMMHWWTAIIAFGLGNPVLYLVSVGIGIGGLVDKASGGHLLGGVPYLQFVAPALLASAAIQGVMDEVTFPVLEGFTWERYFYAINATSVGARQICNGVMLAAAARGLWTVIMYGGILLAFGAIPASSLLPLMVSSLIGGVAWSAAIMAVSANLKNDDGVFAIIGRFVIAPMFLFSGTFYPINLMPIYLQWIGWISPLWHATQLGRDYTIGEAEPVWLVGVHYAYFVVLFAVGMLVSYRAFVRRLGE
ncbi:MAG: ABC transporter permease [Micrococcales bacterium]